MKGIVALIRLHRWQLEQKRLILAELERLQANLFHQADQLEEELGHEQYIAAHSEEALFVYAGYARAFILRRDTLAESIADVEGQISEAHQAVTEAFQEVKRYEIAEEQHEERRAVEVARRDQAILDEIALNMYRQKQAEVEMP